MKPFFPKLFDGICSFDRKHSIQSAQSEHWTVNTLWFCEKNHVYVCVYCIRSPVGHRSFIATQPIGQPAHSNLQTQDRGNLVTAFNLDISNVAALYPEAKYSEITSSKSDFGSFQTFTQKLVQGKALEVFIMQEKADDKRSIILPLSLTVLLGRFSLIQCSSRLSWH